MTEPGSRRRAAVIGVGATGARAARQLLTSLPDIERLAIFDRDRRRASDVVSSLGEPSTGADDASAAMDEADVVVLAAPGPHLSLAAEALHRGRDVVSTSDDVEDVRGLLDLMAEARERARTVVVGAGFGPGLTCVLARHAGAELTEVQEVHVAKLGTGGPACARQHHRSLAQRAVDWRSGAWAERRGGSGRELVWFPDPIGGQDCYRAGLPDALLLAPAFPGVDRVTARVAASRRDRFTALLPMLRRPHAEGSLGAVRVEVRGMRGPAAETIVLGVLDRPAVAAGAVAATAARWLLEGRLTRHGAAGLGVLVADPIPFLQDLAVAGVRAAVFEGSR